MIDIKFLRENPDIVKENIKKKFQDRKLELVDRVIELDVESRRAQTEANELRANRNALSKKIGMLMGQAKKDPSKLEEAEDVKACIQGGFYIICFRTLGVHTAFRVCMVICFFHQNPP